MIRRLLVAAAFAAAAVAILALLVWRWWSATVPAPAFAPGWPASVRTIAGMGSPGDTDGPPDRASFRDPFGVAAAADGTIYVTDAHRIRRIAPGGIVSTLAGSSEPGFVDGPGASARFDTPSAVAIDAAGALYVADTGNHAIRRVTPDGRVTTLAGTGEPGLADGPGATARFAGPVGLALDPTGRLIVADAYNDRIRAIGPDGRVETIAGGPRGGPLDGLAHEVAFDTPAGVAADGAGVLYVADTGGNRVARIDRSGAVSTLALPPATHDASGGLSRPLGIAASPDGHVYVSDLRGIVAEIALDGTARVLAGSRPGFADGPGDAARFRHPSGLAWAGDALGTINRFNHVHLSVGWPGEEHNPLGFRLPGFEDRRPPTIAPRGITLVGEDGSPLRRREGGRLLVRGRVRIIVEAWDRMDANPTRRRLGVYRLGYEVLHADGLPADGFASPLETIRFDVLTPDRSAPLQVYAPGSGIAGRGRRTTRFLYTVTTMFRGGVAVEGRWDTTQLEPSDYVLRILAADIRGNIATVNRDLPVRVVR